METDPCINCGNEIKVMAFKGTDFCSVDCKKEAGFDRPPTGTLVMLTKEEQEALKKTRDG